MILINYNVRLIKSTGEVVTAGNRTFTSATTQKQIKRALAEEFQRHEDNILLVEVSSTSV